MREIFIILISFLLLLTAAFLLWKKRGFSKAANKKTPDTPLASPITYSVLPPYPAIAYDNWLQLHHTYYRQLSETHKKRFLRRVEHFMAHKKFEYIELTPEPEMPLLISAAAVQLTFGMEEYRLDFFEKITLLREEYRYGHHQMPFQGHVNRDGIYLTWNHLFQGFYNYEDAHNLGLHEMAHALTYINFVARAGGEDESFKNRFRNFSKIARPIYKQMKEGEKNLLDAYAATNYHEFWAVAVETFFERSEAMSREMPELYAALQQLLNQDPANMQEVILSERLY